jgi:hypothetical protein
MALDPLQCSACAAPVPLVVGDHGTCPACGASYPIPDTYQALRDEANADARKPEALALAKALGKPPPVVIRAFAMFSSAWFVMLGLGFWIVGGLVLSLIAMPRIGRLFFHVNTYDVLSDSRQMQLMLLVPIGTLVIGLTLSSWARKHGIVRGGLQSALAATPPARPGGPKSCRRCAAPLAPNPGSLTARCPYCQADNLVEMPQAWVNGMRAQATKLATEVDKAEQAWTHEKRALRRGLIIRFTLWTMCVLLPLWFIFGAAAGSTSRFPAWGDQMKGSSRVVDLFTCTDPDQGFRYKPDCDGGRCAFYILVPLRHDEVVRHHAPDLPTGSVADLQMNDEQWLDEAWLTIASAPLSPDHDAVTRAPYSGWYRLRVTVPGEDRAYHRYCVTVK